MIHELCNKRVYKENFRNILYFHQSITRSCIMRYAKNVKTLLAIQKYIVVEKLFGTVSSTKRITKQNTERNNGCVTRLFGICIIIVLWAGFNC